MEVDISTYLKENNIHQALRLNLKSKVFTGIIESKGKILKIEHELSNVHFTIESPISHELKIDQSVAHNGVCLTVVAVSDGTHRVTAIAETLEKTNLKNWSIGQFVNLERCMPSNGRFDGHIVQGHVDTTAKCILKEDQKGSWIFRFEFNSTFAAQIVEKGSICIDGTSLTCFNTSVKTFDVAIIPYTFEHTNFSSIEIGSLVNIEFDIVGKYIKRMMEVKQS